MAPKPWTTEPQLDLLKKYIPQFLAAQAAKKTVKLWPKLFGEWFTLFPEEDIVFQSRDPMEPLSNEQKKQLDVNMKARRSRLKRWFTNHTRTNTDRGRAVAIELIYQFAKSKQACGTRAPKLMEVYSKMHWDKEKSELLAEELGPCLPGEDAAGYSSRRLTLYHEVLEQEWKLESSRIKDEVTVEYEHQLKLKADQRGLNRTLLENSKAAGVDTDEVDAATILSTVNSLPYILTSFFQELQRRTGGFCFTTLVGGIGQGSHELNAFSVHVGETPLKTSFAGVHVDYKTAVLKPFRSFAKVAMGLDTRKELSARLNNYLDNLAAEKANGLASNHESADLENDLYKMPDGDRSESWEDEWNAVGRGEFQDSNINPRFRSSGPARTNTALQGATAPPDALIQTQPQKAPTPIEPAAASSSVTRPRPVARTKPVTQPSTSEATPTLDSARASTLVATQTSPSGSNPAPIHDPAPASDSAPTSAPASDSAPTSAPAFDPVSPRALSPSPNLADNAPTWFREAHKWLINLGLGDEWLNVIRAWAKFEGKLVYGAGMPGKKGYLPATKTDASGDGRRPESVKWWIQCHRLVKVIPAVNTDLEVFQGETIGWWKSINPEWRKSADEFLPIARYDDEEGWGGMMKAGPNGMFLVMICMAWWGKRDGVVSRPIWATMCNDVRRALVAMFDCIPIDVEDDSDESEEQVVSTSQKRGCTNRSTRSTKRRRT